MVKDSRKDDPTKTMLWRVLDLLLVRQLLGDIETIDERGDVETIAHGLRTEVPDVWRDIADMPYRTALDPLEPVTRQLLGGSSGLDEAIKMLFVWRINRRRVRETARLIHAEAERLRKRSNAKGAA